MVRYRVSLPVIVCHVWNRMESDAGHAVQMSTDLLFA